MSNSEEEAKKTKQSISAIDAEDDTTLAEEWLMSPESSLTGHRIPAVDQPKRDNIPQKASDPDLEKRQHQLKKLLALISSEKENVQGSATEQRRASTSKDCKENEPSYLQEKSLENIDQEITLEEGPINSITTTMDVTADFPTTNDINDVINDTGGHKSQETSLVAVARSLSSSEQTLRWLSGHADPDIRAAVASNQKAPIAVLHTLTQDWYTGVRAALLDNAKLPMEIVTKLISDTNPIVSLKACKCLERRKLEAARTLTSNEPSQAQSRPSRAAAQTNPQLPDLKVYQKYLDSKQSQNIPEPENKEQSLEFLELIARRWNTPARRLAELSKHNEPRVRQAVAGNTNSPVDILWTLAFDSSAAVRVSLTRNQSCPLELLIALSKDSHPLVQRSAKEILRNFGEKK